MVDDAVDALKRAEEALEGTQKEQRRLSQTQREAPCLQHPALIDRVGRTRLAMSCGSRDDSLSWNLGRVEQGSATRADDIDHRVEGRDNLIASREQGDERNKDRSFHESRVTPGGKEELMILVFSLRRKIDKLSIVMRKCRGREMSAEHGVYVGNKDLSGTLRR